MKKAIISAIAIAFFALPMTIQADPSKQDASKDKSVKPLSTMKATATSPSKVPAEAAKVVDQKKSDASKAGKDASKKLDAIKK